MIAVVSAKLCLGRKLINEFVPERTKWGLNIYITNKTISASYTQDGAG